MKKNTSHEKSSYKESSLKKSTNKKSSRKGRSSKETIFNDIVNLDEDWDEDWAHLEEETDEDDWEEEFGVPVNRKLLSGMAVACALLLLGVAVLFTLYTRNTSAEQEVAALSFNLSQITLTIPQPSANIQNEVFTGTSNNAEVPASASDNAGVSVGALDDAEDPQNAGTAGNAGTGAEVTVSKTNKDETAATTLGIDVSKYQGTIDWAEVKASGVDFAMIRVGYRAKSTGEIF